MIIFGTRSSNLKSNSTTTYDCDNCNTKNSVQFGFWARYFHVFWIPFFPFSKKGVSQCRNCKQSLYYNEMPQKMREGYHTAAAETKSPLTHYIGLILVGIAMLFFIVSVIISKL